MKLSIKQLQHIIEKYHFPLTVLFGSCVHFLNDGGDKSIVPNDIDILVRVNNTNRRFNLEDSQRLDNLSDEVSMTFNIPCSIHAFDGEKPSDLIGLLALRDGVPLTGNVQQVPSVSDEEIAMARIELYNTAIGMLTILRDKPLQQNMLSTPKSRIYNLESIENMVKTLVRYEMSEIEQIENKIATKSASLATSSTCAGVTNEQEDSRLAEEFQPAGPGL